MPNNEEPGAGRFVAMGLQIAVGVGLGVLVGRWLDRRYGSAPWGVTVGSLLGMASGLYLLIKDALRINKD